MSGSEHQGEKETTPKNVPQLVFIRFSFCLHNDTLIYHLLYFWLRESPYDEFPFSVPIIIVYD